MTAYRNIHYARRPKLRDSAQEQREEEILSQARDILMRKLGEERGSALTSPSACRDYLRLTLGTLEHEEFLVHLA